MWALTFILGCYYLLTYEHTPGASALSAKKWPVSSVLNRSSQKYTLVLHIHPQCPCSQATITELTKIIERIGTKSDIFALVYLPRGYQDEWAKQDLWNELSKVPQIHILIDRVGAEARKFGAQTSGQVFVYKPDGRLGFSGGITGSRGHEGDNRGEDAVISLISTGVVLADETPVFGCHLFKDSHPEKDVNKIKRDNHADHISH